MINPVNEERASDGEFFISHFPTSFDRKEVRDSTDNDSTSEWGGYVHLVNGQHQCIDTFTSEAEARKWLADAPEYDKEGNLIDPTPIKPRRVF